jgi:circadian clock protein KaiB
MTSRARPDLETGHAQRPGQSQLCLYVARGTPNSTRAEKNLRTALDEMDSGDLTPQLEVLDVSAHVKRALSDGVIVTPTLIGRGRNKWHTIVGDLSDTPKLQMFLGSLSET